jgi:hypothetical protein
MAIPRKNLYRLSAKIEKEWGKWKRFWKRFLVKQCI